MKMAPNMPRQTKPIHSHGRIDEDTVALVLAPTGLAIMTIAAASMLVAFAVL
jgi:hypothetical protein